MTQVEEVTARAARLEIRLKPRVITINVRNRAMMNFNYLVVDPKTRDAVIVDPAWEMGKIDQALEDADATLRGILVTHSHPDHIHLANPLAQKYDCPIWMSKTEIDSSRFSAANLVGIDATPWAVGQMVIFPLATPGHTPGSTCYLIDGNLFTGDVLFAEGCGMCPDTQAAHAMYASLELLKALEPETLVFPGHSYGQPPGRAMEQVREENMYLQFRDKHSFAAFRLRGGQRKETMFSFS
jgi:hydroxyacylglutathione hydrolase